MAAVVAAEHARLVCFKRFCQRIAPELRSVSVAQPPAQRTPYPWAICSHAAGMLKSHLLLAPAERLARHYAPDASPNNESASETWSAPSSGSMRLGEDEG
jgi:hypothetical protein